jgi:hypothetical protein
MEKTYKIVAPVGNMVIPKEIMNEKELREFAGQLSNESEMSETWIEKSKKDKIENVVEWLTSAGFTIS